MTEILPEEKEDKVREEKMQLEDAIAVRAKLKPMWIFRDAFEGKHLPSGHLFWCFIGCHYPDGIQSEDNENKYKTALGLLKKELYQKAIVRKHPGRCVGVATGKTPGEAFKAALSLSMALRKLAVGDSAQEDHPKD